MVRAAEADNALMKQGQVWKAHLQKQWLQLVSYSAPPAPSVTLQRTIKGAVISKKKESNSLGLIIGCQE